MSAFMWPTCPRCSRRMDVTKRGPRSFAKCCGSEAEVVLGYVFAAPRAVAGHPRKGRSRKRRAA